jgi:hypothetical protein
MSPDVINGWDLDEQVGLHLAWHQFKLPSSGLLEVEDVVDEVIQVP